MPPVSIQIHSTYYGRRDTVPQSSTFYRIDENCRARVGVRGGGHALTL